MDGNGAGTPGRYLGSQGSKSTMHEIIGHTDNLMANLQMKIAEKMIKAEMLQQNKNGSVISKIQPTKASELRSQSVLATKQLTDIERNLDVMKMNKANKNDASFLEIEQEKQKLAKVF